MAKIANTFKFIGTLKKPKEDEKFIKILTSSNNPNWTGKEVSLIVETSNGSQFVKLFGGKTESSPIKTFLKDKGADGKYIRAEIPFSKRLEKDVIDSVADFRKTNIFDNVYISEWDAVDDVSKNIDAYVGKRVVITGKLEFNVYKGKIYQKYYVSNIFEAKEEQKDGFTGDMSLFINSDTISDDYKKGGTINLSLIEKERQIPLYVYVEQYNKDKETRNEKPYIYTPITVFLSLSDKFDFSNEAHVKSLTFKLDTMLVGKGIYEIGWNVRYFKGSEKEEITMDDLSKFEKAQIENNVKTFEEIVKGKQGWGEFKEEIQLVNFHKSYDEGVIKTDLEDSDLDPIDVEVTESEEVKSTPKVEVIEDEDLF